MNFSINDVIALIKEQPQSKSPEQLIRFGIVANKSYGLSTPQIRSISKTIGINHQLAIQLWQIDLHEAKILAPMIANPKETTIELLQTWVKDFNSWDVVDGCMMNLIEKTPFAWQLAFEWCCREPEYEKRAGFVLMARLPLADRKADNNRFLQFKPYLIEGSYDERNFVKKAVNWAIRQIGKKNQALRLEMMELCLEIKARNTKSGNWITADALRELNDAKTISRIKL